MRMSSLWPPCSGASTGGAKSPREGRRLCGVAAAGSGPAASSSGSGGHREPRHGARAHPTRRPRHWWWWRRCRAGRCDEVSHRDPADRITDVAQRRLVRTRAPGSSPGWPGRSGGRGRCTREAGDLLAVRPQRVHVAVGGGVHQVELVAALEVDVARAGGGLPPIALREPGQQPRVVADADAAAVLGLQAVGVHHAQAQRERVLLRAVRWQCRGGRRGRSSWRGSG